MWCFVPSNPITPTLTAGLNHGELFSTFLGPGQFGYTLNSNTDMDITCIKNWATKCIQVIKRHLSPGQKGPRSPGSSWTDGMFYFVQNLVIALGNSGLFCDFVNSQWCAASNFHKSQVDWTLKDFFPSFNPVPQHCTLWSWPHTDAIQYPLWFFSFIM